MQQRANSPDLNVLDVGFFRSIQSLIDSLSPQTLRDLIKGVEDEFDAYESFILNKIFLSLMTCMLEIMNNDGGNDYKIPHVNKAMFERLGQLPESICCHRGVYARAL